MEATSGFEPLNRGFADLCLTTWLRRRTCTLSDQPPGSMNGRGERIRTPDRPFWRRLLYQLSYTPIPKLTGPDTKSDASVPTSFANGGRYKVRTCDLSDVNAAL